MKRLICFYVILFAIPSLIIAQTDFGICVGSATWWAKCNEPIVKSEFSPAFNLGLYCENPLSDNLFIKTELNYAYLMSNYSYKAVVDRVNWVVVGDGESASAYHQFSIQTQIGYRFASFKPFLGTEYSYRISEAWLNKTISSFGLLAGINYLISDKLSLGLKYYHGLTKDYEYNGIIADPVTSQTIGEYNDFWKSSSLGLTLYYSLTKNMSKE